MDRPDYSDEEDDSIIHKVQEAKNQVHGFADEHSQVRALLRSRGITWVYCMAAADPALVVDVVDDQLTYYKAHGLHSQRQRRGQRLELKLPVPCSAELGQRGFARRRSCASGFTSLQAAWGKTADRGWEVGCTFC